MLTNKIKDANPVYMFIISLTLISLVEVLNYQFEFLPGFIFNALEFLFVGVFIFYSTKLINDFNFENWYAKIIFIILLIYQIITIIRGLQDFDYDHLKKFIQIDYPFWPSIIPIFLCFNKSTETMISLIKAFLALGVLFLVVGLIDYPLITQRAFAESFIQPIAFTCGFLFLNAKYLSKKNSTIAFLTLIICTLVFVYLARRNAIVSYAMYILVGLFFVVKNLTGNTFIRSIPIFVGLTLILLFGLDYMPASLTERLNNRLTEDSRSIVFDNFFLAMQEHEMFGKGVNGKYYCPIDAETTEDGVTFTEVKNRDVIENGYLQLMLTGGYVYIALFVLMLLPAALLGILGSKNQFSQAAGFVILLWLIDMSIFGLPRLILQYVFVWICAGICYKKSIRHLSNDDIQENFNIHGLS